MSETEYFPITSVCRDDIKVMFDKEHHEAIDLIPDHEMKHLASKLADHLVGHGGYWEVLEVRGKDLIDQYRPNLEEST